MIDVRNIKPLSQFQKNAKEHIKRLKSTGEPEVLTVNGEAKIVVQDAAAYQKLLDAVEHARTVEILRRRLATAKHLKSRPMRAALEDLARKHGVSLAR
jgi:PHD/YefM family antitoxin component YafN of YafNO toxin-antitoxin module